MNISVAFGFGICYLKYIFIRRPDEQALANYLPVKSYANRLNETGFGESGSLTEQHFKRVFLGINITWVISVKSCTEIKEFFFAFGTEH